MELWNDFEGKLVDGRFSLERLIGPQGRSAFFATKDEKGEPAVMRVIESLNDEEEILGRWRKVAALPQESLIHISATGYTVLDGTHLVYAVMEPWDAELADVLRERPLTADETRQVALSLVDGLKGIHDAGLVHQHVEASSVLARGESIKLRSDVVRQPEEGIEGLKKADVRDLSLLLLQCLTQRRQVESLSAARLPGTLEEIIRKGENGLWGLDEISAALRPPAPATRQPVPATPSRPAATTPPAGGRTAPAAPATGAASPAAGAATAAAAGAAAIAAKPAGASPAATAPGAAEEAPRFTPRNVSDRLRPQNPDRIDLETGDEKRRWGLLGAIAAGLILLILLGIHFLRSGKGDAARTAVEKTPSAVTVPDQSSDNRPPARDTASAPVPAPAADKPSAAAGASSGLSSDAPTGDAQWRVVAFTYNREAQAQGKVQEIAGRHPNLKPEVFSPNGHGPFLVALGGWMTQKQAESLRSRARGEGLPRDTYIRNYRNRH